MGLFADLRWVDGQWLDGPAQGRHELSVSIHDSDVAAVSFAPAASATGLFFLGFEPADYFEDPDASQPVDHDREAEAFAMWARAAAGREVPVAEVRSLMASPGREPDDVFVPETVAKLLGLLGMQLPEIP